MRRFWWTVVSLMGLLLPISAQDGLNLPTELYILRNEGVVERYGLGTAGVRTVTPEAAFVLDFRVAPDGNWMAYRTPEGLFITNLFEENSTQQIEDQRANVPAIRGQGETVAWSPSSDALAYTTEYGGRVHFFDHNAFADITTPGLLNMLWSPDGQILAAEADEGVWWFFRRDAATTQMMLISAIAGSNGGAWLNARQFIFAPLEGGLNIMDLAAGNAQTPMLDNSQSYHLPQVFDDGRIQVFEGERQSARLIELVSGPTGFSVLDLSANEVDLTDVRWAPNGNLLTAFQGGALALIDPLSGGGFTLPITSSSAYSWGPEYPDAAAGIQLPANAYFLAQDNNGIMQVWRLPADGSRALTITPAANNIIEYRVSADEQQLAYTSNSSLWLYDLNSQDEPQELTTLGINEDVAPAWSADSSTVYYRDAQASGSGIWQIVLQTDAEPSLFLADTDEFVYRNPRLAGGVGAMLVNRGEQLVLVDTATAEQNITGIAGQGDWLSGTRFLAQGVVSQGIVSGNGLFVADVNNVGDSLVTLLPLVGDILLLDFETISDDTVRGIIQQNEPGETRVVDIPITGGQPAIVANSGYLTDPQISPDGSTIIGFTHPNGAMIIYDVVNNSRTLLDTLPQVAKLQWR